MKVYLKDGKIIESDREDNPTQETPYVKIHAWGRWVTVYQKDKEIEIPVSEIKRIESDETKPYSVCGD